MTKLKNAFIAIMVMIAIAFVSCENDKLDTIVEGTSAIENVKAPELNTVQEINGLTQRSGGVQYGNGIYKIDDKYKDSYYHIKQVGNECSWTNYVLCASAIIRGNGNLNYPFHTGDVVTRDSYKGKIAHCKNECRNIVNNGFVKWNEIIDDPSNIYVLEEYNENFDASKYKIYSRIDATRNDTEAAEKIAKHFTQKGTPFIYIGAVRTNSREYPAVKNKKGEWWVGHYFIIWRITWNGSVENSDIWYTDTTSENGSSLNNNIKKESLSSFFARKLNIGSTNNNMLFLY